MQLTFFIELKNEIFKFGKNFYELFFAYFKVKLKKNNSFYIFFHY